MLAYRTGIDFTESQVLATLVSCNINRYSATMFNKKLFFIFKIAGVVAFGLQEVFGLPMLDGVISASGRELFILSAAPAASENRIVSPFLKLGDSFQGWVIEEYNSGTSSLRINKNGVSAQIVLKNSRVREGGVTIAERLAGSAGGLALAYELAMAGNTRIKGKLEALDIIYNDEIMLQKRIEQSDKNMEELKNKYGNDRPELKVLSDAIERSKKSYLNLIKAHAALEKHIDEEACKALNLTALPTLSKP